MLLWASPFYPKKYAGVSASLATSLTLQGIVRCPIIHVVVCCSTMLMRRWIKCAPRDDPRQINEQRIDNEICWRAQHELDGRICIAGKQARQRWRVGLETALPAGGRTLIRGRSRIGTYRLFSVVFSLASEMWEGAYPLPASASALPSLGDKTLQRLDRHRALLLGQHACREVIPERPASSVSRCRLARPWRD